MHPVPTTIEWLDSVGSTNEEAMQRGASGATGPLWIAACEQTGGRGRSGRNWVSPPGNLYASLLLTYAQPIMTLAQLAFVSALAVHETITRLAPGSKPKLKWPNDLLVGGAKISGILIESQSAPQNGAHNVVVGIGLNLAHHPTLADRQATSLAALGHPADPAQALAHLAKAFDAWRVVWAEGNGFSHIRSAWLARALDLGTELTVKAGQDVISGRFRGLDTDGAMLLGSPSGHERRITFGDVHIGDPPQAGA